MQSARAALARCILTISIVFVAGAQPPGSETGRRGHRSFSLREVRMNPPMPGISSGVEPGADIEPLLAQQAAKRIQKQLESSGYPEARVSARLVPCAGGRADLEIQIDRGPRIDIAAVDFSGELGMKASDLSRVLRVTKSKTLLPGVPGIWRGIRLHRGYSREAVQIDAANLRSYYYKRGYFDAEIRGQVLSIHEGKARIGFAVQPGPRYTIRNFHLLGPDGERRIQAPGDARFPMATACAVLLEERRKAERAGVLDFSAHIELHQTHGGPGNPHKWADALAVVRPGPSYRAGRIEFRGNHAFSDATIRRMLLLNEGDPLDPMLLRRTIARLNQTGLFEPLAETSVLVNTPPGSDRADLTICVREKKMRSWFVSGPVGPIGIAGLLQAAVGTRLPGWGQGMVDLSTWTISANVVLFPKSMAGLLPWLPRHRFARMLMVHRPILPGQGFLSGFSVAPQLGWRGVVAGYGVSQFRDLVSGLAQTNRSFAEALPVAITPGGGSLYCEVPKTKLDWMRQITGPAMHLALSVVPL